MPLSHFIAASEASSPGLSTPPSSPSIVTCHSDLDWETLEDDLKDEVEEVRFPVLIDTDGGTEDAWALLMCLRAHKDPKVPCDIVGITCVHGATTVENATKNVRRILRVAGADGIPIYRGSETAMVKGIQTDEFPGYNGHNGFGDSNFPEIDPCTEDIDAVNGIIDIISKHKGKIRILALGPLTNLALAVRVNSSIKDVVRSLFVLGGNMEGVGNATTASEFNFASDPEAAHVVLTTFSCPIFVLPWETSLKFGTSAHSWRMNVLGSLKSQEVTLMNEAEDKHLRKFTENWVATEALCAAIFIEPRVVVKRRKFYCTVELQGSETRGMLVVDHSFRKQKPPNVVLVTEVTLPLYEKMLIWAASGKFYKN